LAALAINRTVKSGPALSAAVLGILLCCSAPAPRANDLAQIEHIVVIYPENRSFDHMYGMFPGANGVANATSEQKTQLDHDGKALPYLPSI
jgi:phospholipase C